VAAGTFNANGSSGRAIYATNDSGTTTIQAYHSASSGNAIWASSNGNGGYFSSGSSQGYGIKAAASGTYANAAYFEGSGDDATTLYAKATGVNGTAASFKAEGTQPALIARNDGSGNVIEGKVGSDTVFTVGNDGVTTVDVLTITGGSDLAEKFDVAGEARPGMVVEIDPEHPGKLRIADGGAYNRRVAGVISGANCVDAGMVLADLPGADNSMPIALTGRVWVYCQATEKAVDPGDMLTTSARPGYAMPVVEHDRANGAVIGKAMTRLEKGQTGMVLALVNLQ
jgi:hypothetical protein